MRLILATIVCFGLAVFLPWSYGPSLVADYKIGDKSVVPAADLVLSGAKCRRYVLLLSACSVSYRAQGGTTLPSSLDFLGFGSFAGERVTLIRSADGSVTTNVGLRERTNRLFTLIILSGFLFCIAVLTAQKAIVGA